MSATETKTGEQLRVGELAISVWPGQLESRPLPNGQYKGQVINHYLLDANGETVHQLAMLDGRLLWHDTHSRRQEFCDYCKRPMNLCQSPSCDEEGTHTRHFNPLTGRWE